MEKNENEELLEQSPAAIQQEDTQKIAKSGEEEPDTEEQKVSNGRFILWSFFAGDQGKRPCQRTR